MPQQQELDDNALRLLATDPRLTPEDLTLLSPRERVLFDRFKPPPESSTLSKMADFGTGAAKGVGQTAFNLGDLVHSTPGVGPLVDALAKAVGPEGTDPAAAFATTPEILNPTNGPQRAGKTAEQIGEFFVPSGPTRLASVRQALKTGSSPLLKSLWGPAFTGATKMTGKVAGEAASAGGVSLAHGDPHPEYAAAIGGSGPLVGKALGAGASLSRTPIGQQVGSLLIAAPIASAANAGTGLGGGLATFGLSRALAMRGLRNPNVQQFLERMGMAAGEGGARGSVGALDQVRARRREYKP